MPQAGDRSTVVVTYEDGKGVLRTILEEATAMGCRTTLLNTKQKKGEDGDTVIRAEMRFQGGPSTRDVMAQLETLTRAASLVEESMARG